MFYKYGNLFLGLFVFLGMFNPLLYVFIWKDFFRSHTLLLFIVWLINVLIIFFIVKIINDSIRHKTLKKIVKDMNFFLNPELALRKYKPCIVDWKRIDSPVRPIYRLILNYPLKIMKYHLAEEIGYDYRANEWKLIGEPGNWELYTGPVVPDDVPIGECQKCNHQIYEEDLEELEDKDLGQVCIDCGSPDINWGKPITIDIENGTISEKIQTETAIVGFIDILGYKSLVQRLQDNIDFISWLEKLIKDRVINFPQRLHQELKMDNPALVEYRSKIVRAISMKAISDTFLFTLYLDRLDFKAPAKTDFDPTTDAMWTYFQMIEMFCLYFIAKTGHVFRGGISIGKHYESNLDYPGNLFIFSTSYLNAFKAEKKASYSRIIIDKELLSYLRSLERFDYIKEHLYEDFDEIYCIHIYSFLKSDTEEDSNPERILIDIKNRISANILFNKNDARALKKLNYFAKYHNNYLKENGYQNSDLYISVEE